jgi:hypothetical protein
MAAAQASQAIKAFPIRMAGAFVRLVQGTCTQLSTLQYASLVLALRPAYVDTVQFCQMVLSHGVDKGILPKM